MAALATRRAGSGPPLLLLHGGLLSGEMAWTEQVPLEERWTVIRVDRAGYGGSASVSEGEDFALDAELLAPDLEPGTHVAGWSSGAVAAMLLAARRPDRVASLTLIEPPVFHVAGESAATRERWHRCRRHWAREGDDDVAWAQEFFALMGSWAPPEGTLEGLRDHIRVWRGFVTTPWEAPLPFRTLGAAGFPKLVLSGGYADGFEDLCDVLAVKIGAERDVIEGERHAVQRTGAPFNERLERLMLSAG